MFLAIKEILHNKLRYSLVVVTIFLIGFMVFFLTSLAVGLSRDNRTAIDSWDASSVVVSDYANNNLNASTIDTRKYKNLVDNKNTAGVGQMSAVVNLKGSSAKINVNIFGLDWDSFISPKLIEGKLPSKSNEVVIDNALETNDVKLNSKIQLNGSSEYYTVVGITKNNSFFTVPVIFTDLNTFREFKYGSSDVKNISAFVLKDKESINESGLAQISSDTLVNHIPGYTEEVTTFTFMIGAMIVITFLVIGIFMYIITIQKISVYGIMRAQGIRTSHIIKSLFYQIFLLAISGIALSMIFMFITQIFLPASVPFYSDWSAYFLLTIAVIVMALSGGLLSIRRVLKIDPISAIGGE